MEILTVAPDAPDSAAIARAADCLRRGGLVAFPTETVYGLGAHALDRDAVRRIFTAKGRPATDPLIVHIATAGEMEPLVTNVPDAARRLADRFWPGPLTIVLPRSSRVPDEVTAGLATVAIRVPAHPVARALLETARLPVAAPSANLFSRPSPTRASHVVNDLDGRVDVILDGGPTTVGLESTVIDLSGPTPTILRPGAISVDALRAVLPDTQIGNAPAQPAHDPAAMPSPGLLLRHYSPRTPLVLYEGEPAAALTRLVDDARAALAAGARVGVLASSEDAARVREAFGGAVHLFDLGSRRDPRRVASRLYDGLRELDGTGANLLLARGVDSSEGLWLAVRDRLRRAAGRIVSP